MPIGGVVITGRPEDTATIKDRVAGLDGIEVHGNDDAGNIVAVLDVDSSEKMEKLIDKINKFDEVLNVGLTYLNIEDEADQLAQGEKLPKPFGFRKPSGVNQ